MLPSLLFYGGAAIAFIGIVATLLPPRVRKGRGRRPTLFVAILGVVIAVTGLALPVREVVVGTPRERLDAIMPRYQFHERHLIAVAAEPGVVDSAIRAVTAEEIRYFRALTWIRRSGRSGPESLINPPSGVPILALATRTGFELLADDPGREIVIGVAGPVSDAARAAARASGRRPFVAAADGYASIAMNFHVVPDGRGGSVLSTETRVYAPDGRTRRAFATYWRVILPGSALIRRGWLDAIRRRAEGEAR